MTTPRRRPGAGTARLALLATACATAALLIPQLPAQALDTSGTPTPVTGNATWFDNLGSPYGGCGLPQGNLDSPHFVALNVYNTPGDYAFYPRPLTGGDVTRMGMWNNGHNCGRWVRVKIKDYCTGVNDGAPGQAFCRNGSWVADRYNDAQLDMIIADSCGDANAWCRDDPYHLDLAHASLNQFVKDGAPVRDMDPNHWGNRRVEWEFIPAPDYTGDITIGFLQGAQSWWGAIAVSHLENGIHGVEYLTGNAWYDAKMNGDMGQSFIIEPLTAGGRDFRIRVRDVDDQLINAAREYSFSLPATCSPQCSQAYTEVPYTTDAGTTTSTTTTSTTTTSRTTPTTTTSRTTPTTTTATTTTRSTTTRTRVTTRSTTTRSTTAPTTTTSSSTTSSDPTGMACSASYTVVGSWNGGFQGEVTVRNTGTNAISSWRLAWSYLNGQSLSQVWNGTLAASGSAVSIGNASWNGAVPVNGSTTVGFLGSWTGSNSVPTVTCTAS